VIERACGRPEQPQNNDRSECNRGKCASRQHQFVGDLALFGFRHLVNATAGRAAAHGMQAMRRLAFGSIRLSACLNKFGGLVMSLVKAGHPVVTAAAAKREKPHGFRMFGIGLMRLQSAIFDDDHLAVAQRSERYLMLFEVGHNAAGRLGFGMV
jgi:hypothetical protein